MRIAVADIEIAEHLVVGAVLLDDEDDVLHALRGFRPSAHPQQSRSARPAGRYFARPASSSRRAHARRAAGTAAGPPFEADRCTGSLRRRLRAGRDRLPARAGSPWEFGPGGLLRLTTKTRPPLALVATALGYQPVGISASNRVFSVAGATTATALMPPRVTSRRPSGKHRQAIGIEALSERRSSERCGRASRGSATSCPLSSIDESESIRIVFSGDQPVRLAVDKQCGRFTDRRDPRRSPAVRSRSIDRARRAVGRGAKRPRRGDHRSTRPRRGIRRRARPMRRIDLSGSKVLLGDDFSLAVRSTRLTESL